MIGGGLIGVVGGAVGGAVIGWDDPGSVTSSVLQFVNNVSSGDFMRAA